MAYHSHSVDGTSMDSSYSLFRLGRYEKPEENLHGTARSLFKHELRAVSGNIVEMKRCGKKKRMRGLDGVTACLLDEEVKEEYAAQRMRLPFWLAT